MKVVVTRYDVGAIGATERTGAGALRVMAALTRPGVFDYMEGSKTIREYRPPEEVLSPESIASLSGLPVTIRHRAMVTPGNWKALSVGHVEAPVAASSGWLEAPVVIADGPTISQVIDGGFPGVSCGYHAELELTPGVTPDGLPYDRIQRGIRYNHLALLPPGEMPRAGAGAALRLDSMGNQIGKNMDDEMKAEISAMIAEVVAAEIAKLTPAPVEDAGEEPKKTEVGEPTKDEKLDSASLLTSLEKQIPHMVAEHSRAVSVAQAYGLPRNDSATTAELKAAVVKKAFPTAKLDSASAVDAHFTAAEALHGSLARATLAQGQVTHGTRKDSSDLSPREQFLVAQSKRGIK